MAAENNRDNLIMRMRAAIKANAILHASVGNTTTVAAPIKPLVAIYHLDTSGGDATIIVGPERHVFVDTGFGASPGRMLSLADKLCPTGPDYISISHFDRDHFYGLGDLWMKFPDAAVITPARPDDLRVAAHSTTCRKCGRDEDTKAADSDLMKIVQQMFEINVSTAVKRAARDDGDPNERTVKGGFGRTCSGGTCMKPRPQGTDPVFLSRSLPGPIDLGDGVTMTSLPTGAGAMDLEALRMNNESSLAWVLSAGGIRYYTAGDLEEREAHLAVRDLHIVKCGHHGSEKATTTPFLNRVNAKVAIIQGAHYGYNHPHADVLQRLKAKSVDTYATGIEISYGARDVSHVIEAGNEVDHAGDIVVIIWENACFSVCYMKDKALAVKTYRNRTLLEGAAAAPFDAAIQSSLGLATYTDLSKGMNARLKEKKDEIRKGRGAGTPDNKPSFDDYKPPKGQAGGRRTVKAKRKPVQCTGAADCTSQDLASCTLCTAKMCKTHWSAYMCPNRRCGRPGARARVVDASGVADTDTDQRRQKKPRVDPQTG